MTRLEMVLQLWQARPCFICGATGNCGHREIEAGLAELDWIETQRPLIVIDDRRAA